jgi:magnesium-transporting ATPase (P-type)
MLSAAIAIKASMGSRRGIIAILIVQIVRIGIAVRERARGRGVIQAYSPPLTTVKRDGKWTNLDKTNIVAGDLLLLAVGSSSPADCRVNADILELDFGSLTGAGLPLKRSRGELCPAGSTVVRGEAECTVVATGRCSMLGRTAAAIPEIRPDGSLEAALRHSERVLAWLSLSLCALGATGALGGGAGGGRAFTEVRAKRHRSQRKRGRERVRGEGCGEPRKVAGSEVRCSGWFA